MGSSHPLSHGELVRVCGYLVGVELGGDDCDEVLEHLVICSKKEKFKGSNSVLIMLSLSTSRQSAQASALTWESSRDSLLTVIFSVPSRGLMMPGTSSPNDRWSIRWEKLYTEKAKSRTSPGGQSRGNFFMNAGVFSLRLGKLFKLCTAGKLPAERIIIGDVRRNV